MTTTETTTPEETEDVGYDCKYCGKRDHEFYDCEFEGFYVPCDQACKAPEKPLTRSDFEKCYEHFKSHKYMGGCSHGI